MATLDLNDYEVANLKYALELISWNDPRPIAWLNTGDWIGRILQVLPEVTTKPNGIRHG